MKHTNTVVVIPTRNRGAIAENAIRSVLQQPIKNLSLLVSDNSTSPLDQETLAGYCANQPDNRLRYVRPPRSLSMSEHWEWAIQEALRSYPADHYLYLTDRMMFRKGALPEVLSLAAQYPDKVLSYNHDRIIDVALPIRIEEYPATERLLEVDSRRFLELFSQAIIHPGLPRMLNCIVPRVVLDRINHRFGNIFSSTAPDFSFCCRCLDSEETILFLDKAPIFHYALDRSNGASVTRGEMTSDNADFTANLRIDSSVRNWATPIPGLNTAINAAFHEYFLFRQTTSSSRFIEVDLSKYLEANRIEISQIVDPELRAEMLSLLVAHGYRENMSTRRRDQATISLQRRIEGRLKRLRGEAWTKNAWLLAHRFLRVRPPGQNCFEFAKLDDAIDYLENVSTGNLTKWRPPDPLLMAREIPK